MKPQATQRHWGREPVERGAAAFAFRRTAFATPSRLGCGRLRRALGYERQSSPCHISSLRCGFLAEHRPRGGARRPFRAGRTLGPVRRVRGAAGTRLAQLGMLAFSTVSRDSSAPAGRYGSRSGLVEQLNPGNRHGGLPGSRVRLRLAPKQPGQRRHIEPTDSSHSRGNPVRARGDRGHAQHGRLGYALGDTAGWCVEHGGRGSHGHAGGRRCRRLPTFSNRCTSRTRRNRIRAAPQYEVSDYVERLERVGFEVVRLGVLGHGYRQVPDLPRERHPVVLAQLLR